VTTLLVILLFAVASATVWHFVDKSATEHKAALRIETEKALQRQRAAYDAECVAQAAAQDVPKRKHRKKV
jgi:hypothetical protein